MFIAAVYVKNLRSHMRRWGLLKFNSITYWDFSCPKNIISTSAFPMCYPLHTVPQLCDHLPCESKPVLPGGESVFPPGNYVVVHQSYLCEENKKSDCSLINCTALMEARDLLKPDLNCDEFLLRSEFKNVLSRSCFHYDVNVVSHRAIEHLLTSAAHGSIIIPESFYCGPEQSISDSPVLLNSGSSSKEELNKQTKKVESGMPSEEQLLNVINRLCNTLLHFFSESHDFTMYHKNIVFHNNIRGVKTRGISSYAQQMYLMRVYGRLHYAQVKVEIMKITHHTEDGTIRVRWRVSGASRRRVLALMWKYRDATWKKIVQEDPEWLDGFSVFSVGPDGLIYKHMVDKMMPDQDQQSSKQNSLRSRIVKLLGLSHQPPAVSGLSAMLAISSLGQNSDDVSASHKTK